MKKVFIDGKAGTTGLRIYERLGERNDITLLTLPDELRKDPAAKKGIINQSDIVFLCLPDAAAMESVALVENPNTVVIDTSTAHRTNPGFTYGFPEVDPALKAALPTAKRIAVPGCHASGFIALVAPLVKAGIINKDAALCCHSLTGYSGGGKNMIAQYEDSQADSLLAAPRQYGLGQSHKHLPEMQAVTGLTTAPIFCPIVANFYSGMEVTVPLFKKDLLKGGMNEIRAIYQEQYNSPIVYYKENADESGFASAGRLSGTDQMEITVAGNDDRILLIARYDNLGKGASGAAVECLNYVLGTAPATGLVLQDR
ncbi:MAG: N-acetyl-gamma-glutamyl-phosphate reductase [Clostridia bacterium]|nr:N-acetyl-gamma-glutamyl-phosphate reductase [Clostridia bacterium]